jgi:hypothetical protein
MKKRLIFTYLWLIIPVMGIVFHYAWGKTFLREDFLWNQIKVAQELEKKAKKTMTPEDWEAAENEYSKIIDTLEDKDSDNLEAQLKLAKARTTLYKGKLVTAMSDLEAQLYRANKLNVDPEIKREIRETLARSQFGIAWVMRNEGASTKSWTSVADRARQNFRYLTETTTDNLDFDTTSQNLETTIKLERTEMKKALVSKKEKPKEAFNSKGETKNESKSKEAINATGEEIPNEAANADGEGMPMEAANADGEGMPMEAANADGEGMPMEAANADGEGMPMEAANADGESTTAAMAEAGAGAGPPGAGPPAPGNGIGGEMSGDEKLREKISTSGAGGGSASQGGS